MRSIVLFVLAVAAMALGTWYIGWWTVPVVGALWAFIAATDRTLPLQAALAGVNAWGILLALRGFRDTVLAGWPVGQAMDPKLVPHQVWIDAGYIVIGRLRTGQGWALQNRPGLVGVIIGGFATLGKSGRLLVQVLRVMRERLGDVYCRRCRGALWPVWGPAIVLGQVRRPGYVGDSSCR